MHEVPYDDFECRKLISFYRNRYYSASRPLDSSIFMSTQDSYSYHGFTHHNDYSCSGFFLCSLERHSQILANFFNSNGDIASSIIGGGDQPYFNSQLRDMQKRNELNLEIMPYRYQAIWGWEMASRYRHLFRDSLEPTLASRQAISSCLLFVSFLHFAGSWPEAQLY